jgi:hypothetical protein
MASPGQVWEAVGCGTRLTSLASQFDVVNDFLTSVVNPGVGRVAVRQVIWPDPDLRAAAVETFWRHVHRYSDHPYERDKRQMLEAAFPWAVSCSKEDLDSMFCWEAASACWRDMGLLDPLRPPHTYTPADYMNMDVLYNGARLGPFTLLEKPHG